MKTLWIILAALLVGLTGGIFGVELLRRKRQAAFGAEASKKLEEQARERARGQRDDDVAAADRRRDAAVRRAGEERAEAVKRKPAGVFNDVARKRGGG